LFSANSARSGNHSSAELIDEARSALGRLLEQQNSDQSNREQ
jgi:hypothetical protein